MIIENDVLRLEVCKQGGEIQSLLYKKTNYEVMWQGSKDHWTGKNPTLWPIVGNTYTKDYVIDGKTYLYCLTLLIRKDDFRYGCLHRWSQIEYVKEKHVKILWIVGFPPIGGRISGWYGQRLGLPG